MSDVLVRALPVDRRTRRDGIRKTSQASAKGTQAFGKIRPLLNA